MTGFLNGFAEVFTFSHFMLLVYIMNTIISLGLIFIDSNKSSSSIMAWIMVLYILPVLGLLTEIL